MGDERTATMGIRQRYLFAVATAAALTLVGTHAVDAAPARHQTSTVYEFIGMADAGEASLTRTGSGVTMNVNTSIGGQLDEFGTPLEAWWESGDATTVWFVVFSNPAGCVDGCGEDEVLGFLGDMSSNPAQVGVHYATGKIATGTTFHAAGRLNEGDMSGVLFGMALQDAMTAEVHLIMHPHGPASALSGQELAAALHSVDGGCGTNICGDSQFAVFMP